MVTIKWELVKDEATRTGLALLAGRQPGIELKRAEVPGGWLVRCTELRRSGLTFVPDPKHEWI